MPSLRLQALQTLAPDATPRCVTCGFADPRALELDHQAGDGKAHRAELKRLRVSLHGWVVANTEAARQRLQLLCSACHTLKTYEQRGYQSLTDGPQRILTRRARRLVSQHRAAARPRPQIPHLASCAPWRGAYSRRLECDCPRTPYTRLVPLEPPKVRPPRKKRPRPLPPQPPPPPEGQGRVYAASFRPGEPAPELAPALRLK